MNLQNTINDINVANGNTTSPPIIPPEKPSTDPKTLVSIIKETNAPIIPIPIDKIRLIKTSMMDLSNSIFNF